MKPPHRVADFGPREVAENMIRMAASKAREEFVNTLNRVANGGERIVLHRRGKDVAALVPVEDLALLEEMEDRMDLEAAREAMKEPGTIPLEQVKQELGL
jgi:prevent-host-death family protein